MAWNFTREESTFQEIPEGIHRVIIESAEEAISRAGNDMLVIKFAVSGYSSRLWHYITYMPDRPEITNRLLTQLFDSFGIQEGDLNYSNYPGKAGAVMVKHDDEGRARVSYCVGKDRQINLPPWKGQIPNVQRVETASSDLDDMPF